MIIIFLLNTPGNTLVRSAFLLLCACILTACATPEKGVDLLAFEAGFDKKHLRGINFEHVVYEQIADLDKTRRLHVYIEGDGVPWIGGRHPSPDPTPLNPLALRMMAMDRAPAIYLGRPCYFGLATSTNCSYHDWTSGRYSAQVVASLLEVIQQYQQAYEIEKIILIGYSGGGTLATLIAPQLPGRVFLLTVSANLNTEMWTKVRGFSPLQGSLNPAAYPNRRGPPQLHLAGGRDEIVPRAVTESYTSGLHPDEYRFYDEFDHVCCWLDLWPNILEEKPWEPTVAPFSGSAQQSTGRDTR